jgi:hypothetical protein
VSNDLLKRLDLLLGVLDTDEWPQDHLGKRGRLGMLRQAQNAFLNVGRQKGVLAK